MAAAFERTKRIRLGSGVVSLPYHRPLMTANRMIQLDHQSRGRVMFGAGPGLLPSDAFMQGIDPSDQRRMLQEGLDVIVRLFNGETVTEETDWYKLEGAFTQLRPYNPEGIEISVASSVTPSGSKLAGQYGLGLLCVAATSEAGFGVLDTNWKIAEEIAAENGREMDRSKWRLVGPMHIAETREQAFENVRFGIEKWLHYFGSINPTAALPEGAGDPVQAMIEDGRAVIGTPDDAIAQIDKLQEKTGGFGAFLQLAHNWANFDETKKSYELYARHVAPHFKGANVRRRSSFADATDNSDKYIGAAVKAAGEYIQKHYEERSAK